MALFTLSSPYRDENRSLIAALKAATSIYNHVAFLDMSNIEHLWNGARSILETVKYMHPRHLHASSAMLRAGSANSDKGLSGGSVLWQPKMAEKRRTDEQTSTQEPFGGVQGQGGPGCDQG